MLENRQRRRFAVKFRDERRRRREVKNVVIGKLLAVQLLEVFGEFPVKRGGLMRVFTITQRLGERRGNGE